MGRQETYAHIADKGATMAHDQEFEAQWTGHDLYDMDGEKIGKVEDVRYGDATGGLKWLVVETGLFGAKKLFIPAADVRRSGDRLSVPHSKDRVKNAPQVEDKPVLTQPEEAGLCRYYGLQYFPSTGGTDEGCEEMEDKRPGG